MSREQTKLVRGLEGEAGQLEATANRSGKFQDLYVIVGIVASSELIAQDLIPGASTGEKATTAAAAAICVAGAAREFILQRHIRRQAAAKWELVMRERQDPDYDPADDVLFDYTEI